MPNGGSREYWRKWGGTRRTLGGWGGGGRECQTEVRVITGGNEVAQEEHWRGSRECQTGVRVLTGGNGVAPEEHWRGEAGYAKRGSA